MAPVVELARSDEVVRVETVRRVPVDVSDRQVNLVRLPLGAEDYRAVWDTAAGDLASAVSADVADQRGDQLPREDRRVTGGSWVAVTA